MDIQRLPYRENVSCVVFKDSMFLLVQLKEWPENFWKFPQGGKKQGETEEQTVFRELKEELGTDRFKIIGRSSHINKYSWDYDLIAKIGFKWKGQIQRFYLVEFLGRNEDIKINKEEIKKHKWVEKNDIYQHIDHAHQIFFNYKNSIEKVIVEFRDYLK